MDQRFLEERSCPVILTPPRRKAPHVEQRIPEVPVIALVAQKPEAFLKAGARPVEVAVPLEGNAKVAQAQAHPGGVARLPKSRDARFQRGPGLTILSGVVLDAPKVMQRPPAVAAISQILEDPQACLAQGTGPVQGLRVF